MRDAILWSSEHTSAAKLGDPGGAEREAKELNESEMQRISSGFQMPGMF